jgi:hypothetical protein
MLLPTHWGLYVCSAGLLSSMLVFQLYGMCGRRDHPFPEK